MKLVIAEKPSLAADIEKALPGNAIKKDGYIEKGDYCVTWVFGHMLRLKEPEDYDSRYSEWKIEDLPIYFDNWQNKIASDKEKQVKIIGQLIKKADMVIHAGDPDDEGQLLIDELLRWFNYTGSVKRLDCANTTILALKKALGNLKDNKPLEITGYAAYARSISDLIFGINISRFFSITNRKKLVVGRVQTPTLGLVVNRDALISSHKKLSYYELFSVISINGKNVEAKLVLNKDNPDLEDGRILNKELFDEYLAELKGNVKCEITKDTKQEHPPLPFNLLKLQSYCGKNFKYKPSEVMEITQSLREKHKAITYNRSDCQYLSSEHYQEAPELLNRISENVGEIPEECNSEIKSKCFNDENITAHFAIIPQNISVDINKLTEKEKNVYLAIVKYYVVQFLPPAEKEKTELTVKLPFGTLKASSTIITKQGYLKYLKENENDEYESDKENGSDTSLSDISAGEYTGEITENYIKEKETKPPTAYTETTLNEDMCRISKYVKDPEIKKILLEKDKDKKGENGSIGTPATRGSIIDNLIKHGLIEEKSGKLHATKTGSELYRILPDEIKTADVTAKWWMIQERIKSGESAPEELIQSVLDVINKVLNTEHEKINIEPESIGKCPKCGKPILDTKKAYSCEGGKGCGFVIWKTMCDKSITRTQAEKLLNNKKTDVIKGFKSKQGKNFDARLILNSDCKVEFDFSTGTTRSTSKFGSSPKNASTSGKGKLSKFNVKK